MTTPKYQTAIEIINDVIVPQIDINTKDIKAITKEVISNAKDFDKKVEDIYNTLEAKEEQADAKVEDTRAEYVKYCKELENQIKDLTKQITSDTSTQDIGKIVDELSIKIEALESEEAFEYDDTELKDAVTKLNVDFGVFKEKLLTSQSVIDEINSKGEVIEASSIKGLIETLNNIANLSNNSNVKVAGSILEVLSAGTSVMQGVTRLNFTNATVAYNKGTIDITTTGGGGGTPGGLTTQVQFNDAGSFAGDSSFTWDKTAKTLTIGNALGYSDTGILESLTANANSFNQLIIRNTNAGTAASSNLIVNNDVSTSTTFYGELGMNSSGFTGTGNLNKASAVYLASTSGDLSIGTTTSNPIHFVVNNGATDALTISSTGVINIPGATASTITSFDASKNLVSITTGTGVITALGLNVNGSGAISLTTSPVFVTPTIGVASGTSLILTEAVGSSALTLTGANQTSSFPVIDATQTWKNAGTTFAGIKLNITNTASNAASLLMDLQVGGTSLFNIRVDGQLGLADKPLIFGATTAQINRVTGQTFGFGSTTVAGAAAGTVGLLAASNASIGFSSATNLTTTTFDTILTRKAAANFQLGATDAAAPVAQTLSVQSVVTGTTNTAGTNFTITGSQGTGTGAGGSLIFQVAPAGTTGSTPNALATALTIASTKTATFAGDVSVSGSFLAGNGNSFAVTTGFHTVLWNGAQLGWASAGAVTTSSTADAILTRRAAATINLGAADAASPVAQTLSTQGSRAGTDTNVGGANLTIQSGIGTGTGTASSIVFKAPVAVGSGTGAQTATTALTLTGTTATFTGQVTAPNNLNTNNAITAVANAATVPITSKINTVTNNSAAGLTITLTTSGAIDGQITCVRILDFSAVAQTLTFVNTENSDVSVPATSNGSTTLPRTVLFQYNSATSKHRCIANV